MSDGVPTDEQLRRIERGVQRRIDLRRTVARRVAGTTAAVALLGGGLTLLVPLALGSASSGGSTAAGGTAASARSVEEVVCHGSSARDSRSVRREAPAGAGDRRLIEACGATAVDFQSGSGRLSTESPDPASAGSGSGSGAPGTTGQGAADAPSASSSALTSGAASPSFRGLAVLCRAADGVLHVYPADARPATLCERNGMRPR